MYKTGILQGEDDAKKVAKMMENQLQHLKKEREESARLAGEELEREQKEELEREAQQQKLANEVNDEGSEGEDDRKSEYHGHSLDNTLVEQDMRSDSLSSKEATPPTDQQYQDQQHQYQQQLAQQQLNQQYHQEQINQQHNYTQEQLQQQYQEQLQQQLAQQQHQQLTHQQQQQLVQQYQEQMSQQQYQEQLSQPQYQEQMLQQIVQQPQNHEQVSLSQLKSQNSQPQYQDQVIQQPQYHEQITHSQIQGQNSQPQYQDQLIQQPQYHDQLQQPQLQSQASQPQYQDQVVQPQGHISQPQYHQDQVVQPQRHPSQPLGHISQVQMQSHLSQQHIQQVAPDRVEVHHSQQMESEPKYATINMDPKFYLRKLSIPEQLRKYSLPEHLHKLNINVNSGMSKLRRRKKGTVSGPPPQLYQPEFQQEVAKKLQQQQLEQQQQQLLEQQKQQQLLEQNQQHKMFLEQQKQQQNSHQPVDQQYQQQTDQVVYQQPDQVQYQHQHSIQQQSYSQVVQNVDNQQYQQTVQQSQSAQAAGVQYQNSVEQAPLQYQQTVEQPSSQYPQTVEQANIQYQQSVEQTPVQFQQSGQGHIINQQNSVDQAQMVYHQAQYQQSVDQGQVIYQAVEPPVQQLQYPTNNQGVQIQKVNVQQYQQTPHQQAPELTRQHPQETQVIQNPTVVQQQQPQVQQVQQMTGQATHQPIHQPVIQSTAQHLPQPPVQHYQQQQIHLVPLQQVGDAMQGLSCIQQVQPVHELIKEEQTGQLTLMMSGAVGVHGIETRVLESEELVRAVEEKPHSQILQEPMHPLVKKIQEIQSKPVVQNMEGGVEASQPVSDPKNLAVEVPGMIAGGTYLSPGSVGASGTSGYNSQQSTVTSDLGVNVDPVITLAGQERDKSVESSLPPNGHQGDMMVKEAAKEGAEVSGPTNDSDTGLLDGEGKTVRKKTKKERKRTHLGPRIKVLRIVTGEEALEPGQVESPDADSKTGVKVECQMETSKQKTVTFEFSTTDIVPEEMATTFIREDLLAEQHRKILVEQLVDIVSQLTENPEKLPSVTFPPEECLSPTREKRERSSDSVRPTEDPATLIETKEESPQSTVVTDQAAPQSPARRVEKPPEVKQSKIKRFQVSPVVENKPLPGEGTLAPVISNIGSELSQSPNKLGDVATSTTPHTHENSNCATTPHQQGDQATATTPHQHGTTPDTTVHPDTDMASEAVMNVQTQYRPAPQAKKPQTTDNSLETVKMKLEQLELDQAAKRSNRPNMNLSLTEPTSSGLSPGSEQRQATPPQLSPAGSNPLALPVTSPEGTIIKAAVHPAYVESKPMESEPHPPTHMNDVSVMSDLEANLALVFSQKEPLVMQVSAPNKDLALAPSLQLTQQANLSGTSLPGIIPLDGSVNVAISGAHNMGHEFQQVYSLNQESLPTVYSQDQDTVPAGYTQYQVVMPLQRQEIMNQPLQSQLQGEPAVSEHDGQQQIVGELSNTVKSLEDVMGEPARQSTPVSSPDRSQTQEAASNAKLSRFAVQKVDEQPQSQTVTEQELTAALQYNRSRSISNDGRVSAEAEHYDSSPSPGSCYDTASESVEPTMLQMYGDQVMYNGPLQAVRSEVFPALPPLSAAPGQDQISIAQEPRRPSHSWPATWPDATRPITTWADSAAQTQQAPRTQGQAGAVNNHADDHHTSGDSIPVGCEASHLDISQDSGLASLIREPLLQQATVPIIPVNSSHMVTQEQYRQPQVQENFCPGPESTFMPVEPAKEPPLDVESVEDDHNEITEEESFIQNALNRLDQRHAAEMEILQRRMEELQRHYMKEKENLRVDLVSTLFNARKMVQQQEMAAMAQAGALQQEADEAGVSPQLLQLQQQQQIIQQQINEHMRQQQQVQQHQQNFNQLQSAGQRDVQQQQILQQQLQQQLNSLMFSPPPGHTSRSSQGHSVPPTSPGQQVLQPVPARYAYVSAGGQPQFLTINGQQLQVVGGLSGQQLVAAQGAPGQPQQFFSLTQEQMQQLTLPRPQSFVPARFSPRAMDQENRDQPVAGTEEEQHRMIERLDAASVMSEPSRPVVMEQHKRDSFSDSGAEGSGHNTPTRGRTITEGLLRYVQDSSVARPQQRYSNVENPVGHPGLQNPNLHNQTQAFQTQKPGSNLGFQTPQLQNPGFQSQSLHTLTQNPTNYVLQNPPQNLSSAVNIPNNLGSMSNVQNRGSVASLHNVAPANHNQNIGVVQPQPVGQALAVQTGRESVPLTHGRESVPLGREGASIPLAGRESVPLGLAPLNIPPAEPQACHVPVIQAVAEQNQLPYPSVIQQNYLPGASYPTSMAGHTYSSYPQVPPYPHNMAYSHPMSAYHPGKSLGSAPPYAGPAPGFSNLPGAGGHFAYSQFAGSNPLQTFPPGPMCSTPGSVGGFYPPDPSTLPGYGNNLPSSYQVASPPPSSFQPVCSTQTSTGEVTTIRQPIMSSTAQPSHLPTGYSSVSGMIPVMMVPPTGLPNAVYRYSAPANIPGSPLSPPGVDHGAHRSQHPPSGPGSHLPPVPQLSSVHGSIGHNTHNSFQPNPHPLQHSQHSLHSVQPLSANQSMTGSYHESQAGGGGGGSQPSVLQEDLHELPEKPA
eukprot:GFUD01037814.1.p1 GENE.GFUD01037814.1~~GFUD01037814.1.p1  ORF type:complete len:3037 (-),score=859.26 GFUD01037814.1:171-7919(-)